jgi:hypothetical protein
LPIDILFIKIVDALPSLPGSSVCGRCKSAYNKMAAQAFKFANLVLSMIGTHFNLKCFGKNQR